MKQISTIQIISVLFLPTSALGHWVTTSGPMVHRSRPFLVPSDSHKVGYHLDPLLQALSGNPLAEFGILSRNIIPSLLQAELNEYETDEAIEVAIEVPGVKAEDITVQVEDEGRILRLKGERSIKSKDGTSFSSSKFDKMFSIDPSAINVDEISVSLDSGIITVHLPKIEKKANETHLIRKIDIIDKGSKKIEK